MRNLDLGQGKLIHKKASSQSLGGDPQDPGHPVG